MIKAVFFDLDGTLLGMDENKFVEYYFGLLAKRMSPYGYQKEDLIKTIWAGTKAMYQNDGKVTNDVVFWDVFKKMLGPKAFEDKEKFDAFYENEFLLAKEATHFQPLAREAVEYVKNKGIKVILATNPIFPYIATKNRASWANCPLEIFDDYTSYENCGFCKPNLKYFEYLFKKHGLKPEEVLMVGNNALEDMIIAKLGSKTFLLTDDLINRENVDIDIFPHGNFSDLLVYLKNNL